MRRALIALLLAALAALGAGEEPPAAPAGRNVTAITVHRAKARGWDESRNVEVTVAGEAREMPLADYLSGVLLGEMPASFPLEALKAQAVAARTYTLSMLEAGKPLSDDPAVCQAYIPPEAAGEKLGGDPEAFLQKLRRAVEETDGMTLTYGGDYITATYFSSASGRTESAQAVWGGAVPYLVSVESPEAPRETVTELTPAELMARLEVADLRVEDRTLTQGGGVASMTIGGKTFTGPELRKLLGLPSTCFTLEDLGDTVRFTVSGSGHRVGMSQYGAKTMAEEGKDFREILRWYYPGAELRTEE